MTSEKEKESPESKEAQLTKKGKKGKKSHLRYQFQISERSALMLDNLVEVSDCVTRGELIRKALLVYESLMDAVSRGAEIVIHEKDGRERQITPL